MIQYLQNNDLIIKIWSIRALSLIGNDKLGRQIIIDQDREINLTIMEIFNIDELINPYIVLGVKICAIGLAASLSQSENNCRIYTEYELPQIACQLFTQYFKIQTEDSLMIQNNEFVYNMSKLIISMNRESKNERLWFESNTIQKMLQIFNIQCNNCYPEVEIKNNTELKIDYDGSYLQNQVIKMLSILTQSIYGSIMLRSYNVAELFLKILQYQNQELIDYCINGLKYIRKYHQLLMYKYKQRIYNEKQQLKINISKEVYTKVVNMYCNEYQQNQQKEKEQVKINKNEEEIFIEKYIQQVINQKQEKYNQNLDGMILKNVEIQSQQITVQQFDQDQNL